MSTYRYRMVNGKRLALTAAEIAELEARDAAWAAGESARTAKVQRTQGLKADAAVIDLATRLASSTSAQIDTYFANNVTNAAGAIQVLKAVVKLLAWRLR